MTPELKNVLEQAQKCVKAYEERRASLSPNQASLLRMSEALLAMDKALLALEQSVQEKVSKPTRKKAKPAPRKSRKEEDVPDDADSVYTDNTVYTKEGVDDGDIAVSMDD